jgi:hypothetical protein
MVSFAGVLFLVAAGLNLIVGLTSLFDEDFLAGDVPLADLEVWGVILLVVAALQFAAGLGILARTAGARLLGIGLAALGAIAHFSYHDAASGWSFTLLVVDLLIVYTLVVHADEFE